MSVPSVSIGGKVFSASQIVGKTLIARRTVPVYRVGQWNKPFGKVRPGAPVGVVYSWIGPTGYVNTNGKLYWQFYNTDGTTYYAEQTNTSFDLSALKQQGAITALEQVEQEREQDKEPPTLLGTLTKLGITAIAVWGAVTYFSNRGGGNKGGRIIYLK